MWAASVSDLRGPQARQSRISVEVKQIALAALNLAFTSRDTEIHIPLAEQRSMKEPNKD